MTEAEFERDCQRLWSEIEDAVAIFYTAEEIQDCARRNENVLDACVAQFLVGASYVQS